MEAGSSANGRMFAATAPVVMISIGYIDPGKWVSCIDSGARFGGDLVLYMLVFNLVAVLCHYLSARIGVTGRSLAQICSEEYDKLTCVFLGVQAELSVISLDLTMIVGIAHGLNMIFGADMFNCVLLTALNAVLYPLFSTVLDNSKVKFLVVCMAGLVLVCYVLGMLITLRPEFPVPSNGSLLKLSSESAFALMSLLGANIMPHNFYLCSSIVQRYQAPASVLKRVWFHDNFIVTLTIFSGIFLVNYVLMNSAANVFYSTGIGLLTFQDSMSLLDQAYRNRIIPFASLVILFLANQITALSWEFCAEGGETMLHEFFSMYLPEWLHRASVRTFAVVPVLYCLWHSGAEGIYHMLLCTQVMVALLLPSSLIPLFRVASSRPIMGVLKISPIQEYVVLLTFMGMLGLEIIFVVEMIFGESDWVGNLRWSLGNTTSITYVFLLITACVSFSFMLWLAATPLKSATARPESQPWNWDTPQVVPESFIEREGNDVLGRCYEEEPLDKRESLPSQEKSYSILPDLATTNNDVNLPETIMDTIQKTRMTTIEENSVVNVSSSSSKDHPDPEQSIASVESVPASNVVSGTSDILSLESRPMKPEVSDSIGKMLGIEGDTSMGKDDVDGDTWEPEYSSKDVPVFGSPVAPEGPGSFRSLSGKSDEGGTGAGSLSRLSGLGRAARRQLAVALDEFWGQLYDLHGQFTHEAKGKKLDQLLGVDSKPSQPPLTSADSAGKDFGMQFQSLGGRVSDNPMNSSLYDTPNQQKLQNNTESVYRAQRGSSSLWSNQMQMLDTSNRSMLDAGERRYQSLRLPPSSEGLEYQPATIHGYQFASYLNRMAKDRPGYMNDQLESLPQKSRSMVPINYRDSLAFALGQKSVNGFNSVQRSSFQNLAGQRNSMLQSDKPYFDLCSARPVENIASQNNTKKYHSLPDISGLSVPLRNQYLSDRSTQWDVPSTNTSMGFGTSVGRTIYEPSYASTGSRAAAPLAFDELSPSRAYSLRLGSVSDTGSLWSRQPFEQFGVANRIIKPGVEGAGNRSSLMAPEPLSLAEMESKLLQSLRLCILKLLKLEGSEWLFRPNDGVDEDLIDWVATRERFVYEVESRDLKQPANLDESQYSYSERKPGMSIKGDESNLVSSVPHCGEGCVWKVDLIVSFGVWCIHRILELSLMESRPELWGKYTYVLNRLQGVIDLAFFKPRTPMPPCFCLQIPVSYQMKSSPPIGNGMLPPTARPSRGKVTTSTMLLDMIKDVEMAISCRKGRSGTAAGDVAFPKGKENLASVLKRYKRRMSNKSISTQDSGPGSQKLQSSSFMGHDPPGASYGVIVSQHNC